ncbi:DUF3014 domain-containing protein [Marinibactrum halimedae]|uniref:DUF3014 domain-containing protein n=1 Tax=Marinibactrum halimedae TaxID=1444977 RepID=A0AA37T6I7_9GAMM|nr:DUF3014 domain-containing protein [Marinibactrum halimedae]MCD9461064.1 DUF3014 domain-containing protein [Marinibactrum halimedae]GLS26731.1 hypothetical protein GCM10007877_24490 [Marinibactrum halimedae]
MDQSESRTMGIIALVVGLGVMGGVMWWVFQGTQAPAEPEPITEIIDPPASDPEPIPSAPDIPEPPAPEEAPAEPTQASEPPSPPEPPKPSLPALNQSDALVREMFQQQVAETDYQLWWQPSNLLQRWITVIDGVSKGELVKGILPIQPPKQKFPVRKVSEGVYELDEAGFTRFDAYVDMVTSIDPSYIAKSFHTLRPLLEEAYGQLGKKPETVDNAIIQAIDTVLNAPISNEPLKLLAPSVSYVFADEAIEKRSPIEKQLLRMGPENTEKLQHYLRTLRSELMGENAS